MKMFKIEVQELLAKQIEVRAINLSDAMLEAKKQYKKTEIVLDKNDFVEVDFIEARGQSKKNEKNILMKKVLDYLYNDEKRHFEELEETDGHIFVALRRLKILLD